MSEKPRLMWSFRMSATVILDPTLLAVQCIMISSILRIVFVLDQFSHVVVKTEYCTSQKKRLRNVHQYSVGNVLNGQRLRKSQPDTAGYQQHRTGFFNMVFVTHNSTPFYSRKN